MNNELINFVVKQYSTNIVVFSMRYFNYCQKKMKVHGKVQRRQLGQMFSGFFNSVPRCLHAFPIQCGSVISSNRKLPHKLGNPNSKNRRIYFLFVICTWNIDLLACHSKHSILNLKFNWVCIILSFIMVFYHLFTVIIVVCRSLQIKVSTEQRF